MLEIAHQEIAIRSSISLSVIMFKRFVTATELRAIGMIGSTGMLEKRGYNDDEFGIWKFRQVLRVLILGRRALIGTSSYLSI